MIKELIRKMLKRENISKEDRQRVFMYLRHIPNKNKTEEEWELYKILCKEKGVPEPDRNLAVRPVYEKLIKHEET